jgi:hypothetical protein
MREEISGLVQQTHQGHLLTVRPCDDILNDYCTAAYQASTTEVVRLAAKRVH